MTEVIGVQKPGFQGPKYMLMVTDSMGTLWRTVWGTESDEDTTEAVR